MHLKSRRESCTHGDSSCVLLQPSFHPYRAISSMYRPHFDRATTMKAAWCACIRMGVGMGFLLTDSIAHMHPYSTCIR
jgi:hypothetical protein